MKSIRTNPANHAGEGDERTREFAEARRSDHGPGAFRAFHVTATVYFPRGAELPTMAVEWFDMVNSMGSSLVSVTEIRYPLADDVIEQRKRLGTGPIYG